MTDDLMKQLDEELAPSWIAEAEGDLISGKILRFGSNTTDYGTYPVMTLAVESATTRGQKLKDLELAVHLMGAVLANWYESTEPQKGGRAAIRYNGKVASKTPGNNPYKNWSTAYEPPPTLTEQLDAPAETGGTMFD